MAHKLLAPFKQLPIFKKSSDKWKEISLSNYNSVYGMLDDITTQSFDDQLHLFAIGTKRGEIKIYGSTGVIYTLIGSVLKPISILKFLHGQGRLLSVTNDNDIVMWEYKIEQCTWEVASTLSIGSLMPNSGILTLDVSHPMSWKSDDDNLIQLLLLGLGGNKLIQILIVGNRFHVYGGDDLSVDGETVLSKCSDLSKEYEFGEIMSIKFNSSNNDNFFVAFNNGLILLMKSCATEPKTTNEETVVVKEHDDIIVEPVEEAKEHCPEKSESAEQQNGDDKTDKCDEEKEKVEDTAEKSEQEKPKSDDDTPKVEEIKVEVKKIKESVQVPFVNVKMPLFVNYVVKDHKINGICWSNDDVVVNCAESNDMCFYGESEVNFKLVEPHKIASVRGDHAYPISHLTYLNRNDKDVLVFVAKIEDSQNMLCLVTNNEIEVQFETPSKIIDYVIVSKTESDDKLDTPALSLLILCESQLIAIDLGTEQYTEQECPYLVLRTSSHVTAVTSIVQVSPLLFPNHKTVNELFQNWPLNTPLSPTETSNEESIDILATGHADGTINIWQVMLSGVLSILTSINNGDLFKIVPPSSNSNNGISLPKKLVGHRLISSDDNLMKINNIQLINNVSEGISDTAGNGLCCVVGNCSGTVFIFKYDRSEVGNGLVEITSDLKDCCDKDEVVWNDVDAPELLATTDINSHSLNLSHIIKLNPSLPVTALAFQPQWNMIAVGHIYGFVLIDLKQNHTVFSYSTLAKAQKNAVAQAPLSVGQQLKKSMRQSFRKLKKLKPAAKHNYSVTDDKSKEKGESKTEEAKTEETKPEVEENVAKENDHKSEQGETIPEKSEAESKEKVENSEKCAATETVTEIPNTESEPPIEISRKDKPSGTIRSLLIVATSLVSSTKEPCLFAGTNMGSIFAFELKFDSEVPVNVTLSKELHLQHKAPVLMMGIVNSCHVPLICNNEVSSYQRKCSVIEDKPEEIVNDLTATESEIVVGPSGDADDQQASGTLPSPQKVEENDIEKIEPARKSVDGGRVISTGTTMKKSGTLPASFLQAIGKTSGNSDSHELLVVSEEQVKLFSLPTLKAKYKYKVVDTGHHYSHNKSNSSQENEQNSQEKKTENADTNNIDVPAAKKQIRRILTVGLCKIQGHKQLSNKWGVSIALTNGEVIALTLNNLKKYLSNLYNSNSPILTSVSDGELNLIVSFAHQHNLQITDYSQAGTHHFEPLRGILVPDSARPVVKVAEKCDLSVKVDQPADEEIKSDSDLSKPVVTNGQKSDHMNGHVDGDEIDEEKDQLGDETSLQNPSTTHHGDITMDSIKEYITNKDGNITVKTFESSTEKHITVNDGQIVTTIHERQMKDGDVIKDETVKITSDTVGSNAVAVKE